MNRTPLPNLLIPTDVARWLVLPTSKVERWARRGQIPAIVLPDGNLVFERDQLVTWLENLRKRQARERGCEMRRRKSAGEVQPPLTGTPNA